MSKPHTVDPAEEEFARKVAELSAKAGTSEAWAGVYGLRAVEEAWARHLLGIGDGEHLHRLVQTRVEGGLGLDAAERALAHLEEAEQHQWTIGSAATGSGEGLTSMSRVRQLQTAEAWLEVSIAQSRIAHARQLAAEVEHDPNGSGESYLKCLEALEGLIAQST